MIALLCVAAVGCGDDGSEQVSVEVDAVVDTMMVPETVAPTPDTTDTVMMSMGAVVFEPCELTPGQGDMLAECAVVQMPLDHEDPEGERIDVAVKRVRAPGSATKALWFLPGGPGQQGLPNMQSYATIQMYAPDIDVYTLDHRGTGQSTRLSCPSAEAPESERGVFIARNERDVCASELRASWGDRLAFFSRSGAARDVIALAQATRDERGYDQVILRGGSYGSAWARRALELSPQTFDAAVLTAILTPDTGLESMDAHMDQTGRAFLQLCNDNGSCRDALGPDPEATLTQLYADLAQGACSEVAIDGPTLRWLTGDMLSSITLRSLVLPLLARFKRCAPADVQAINMFFTTVFGGTDVDPSGLDWPLFFHVSASELVSQASPSAQTLIDGLGSMLFATGRGADIAHMREGWPVYTDQDAGLALAFEGPMLWMHGGRDPLLPLGPVEARAAQELGANQRFVVFADAGHGLVGGTPALGGGDCAFTLELEFLNNPQSTETHPCVSSVIPALVAPNAQLSTQVFGDANPWGDQ